MKLLPIHSTRRLFSTRRRTIVIIVGLALVSLSVYYTWRISSDMRHEDEVSVQKLKDDEQNIVEMWVDIVRSTNLADAQNYNILTELAEHTTIPIAVTDDFANHLVSNLPKDVRADREKFQAEIQRMSALNDPITVTIPYGFRQQRVFAIYYGNTDYHHLVSSAHSDALAFFPYVQLVIIIIFAIFAYIVFLSTKQNEQNRVWVGLAKETAHQLGTPTSSLLGWVEYMRSQPVDQMAVEEMAKDLVHLNKIVDRFSKIGSETQLATANINEVVGDTVMYFRRRIPRNVTLNYNGLTVAPITAPVNVALFEWVIENLLKNSLDALQGQGSIDVVVGETANSVYVDVTDTGKGIAKGNWNRIFEPGFTTKTRGWGLGLSLSRRIIEEYHRGKIAVVRSEVGRGTTIRVTLKRASYE